MNSTLRDCPGRLGALRDLSGRFAFNAGRRLTAPVVLLLMVAALIAPLASPAPAGATLCPPGYVEGPGTEVVNADGSVTYTPGPCVPKPRINIPGGPIIDVTPEPAEDIDFDGPILVDPTPTPPADDPGQGDGEVIDADDPIVVPTEEADIPIVLPPDEDSPVAEPGDVVISKFVCPVGYDAASADVYELALDCNDPLPGIDFFASNGDQYVDDQTSGSDGTLEFDEAPFGPLSVVEQVPAGYGEPVVHCTTYEMGQGGPVVTGPTKMTIDAGNQFFTLLEAGQTLYCSWYNVPTGDGPVDGPIVVPGAIDLTQDEDDTIDFDLGDLAPADRGEISRVVDATPTPPADDVDIDVDGPILVEPAEEEGNAVVEVHKRVCPDGYDPTGKAFDVLYSDCNGIGDGIAFSLTANGVDLGTQTVGSIFSNIVQWADVPAGSIAINEFVPDGYGQPLVNCYLTYPDGSTIAADIQLIGPAVTYNLGATDFLVCDWFNVPLLEEGDDPTDDPGDVAIAKFVCPLGYDADSADIFELAYDCNEPLEGVEFDLSVGVLNVGHQTTGSDGVAEFDQIPFGSLSVVEQVPDGYGTPVVYCTTYQIGAGGPIVTGPFKVTVDLGNQTFHIFEEGQTLNCSWYNIPTEDSPEDEPGDVVITKYLCPAGYDAENADIYELAFDCNETLGGIQFTATDGDQYVEQLTTGSDGVVEFDQVPFGPLSIVEQLPGDLLTPVVYCTTYEVGEGGPIVTGPFKVTVEDGNQIFDILEEGQTLYCSWYNIPYEEEVHSSIIILKYTCPPGYDFTADGADPASECWDLTDGIDFTIDGPNGYAVTRQTGEDDPGAFGEFALQPGTYTVTEQVPAGTKAVFVLDCAGSSVPLIQSLPLSVGASLDIIIAGSDDDILCRWYNVPEHNERGDIEVTKYFCATATFVTVDACQRYEGGQAFRLTGVAGPGAGSSADGTTDATGRYVWAGLLPGTYEIDEIGAEWCYASADYTDTDGYLVVEAGVTTHVAVYNCGFTPPTKNPVKYPNTGVGPAAAVISGGSAAPVAPAGAPVVTEETGSEIDLRLPAVRRGERPVEIAIDAAEVDAPIEVLEVIDGAMQDPTGATHVAWYKDTAALGVSGHIVMAGHLNYWGVPEGVFFAIDRLEEGDEIVVTGESGAEYRYEVVSVGQEDALAAPADEVLSPDGDTTLTLITCGGEWDAARGEYLSRTVVQATLIAS